MDKDQQEQPHSPPRMGLRHAYKHQTPIWTETYELAIALFDSTSLIILVDHFASVNEGSVM
jgi:hypothetical protein